MGKTGQKVSKKEAEILAAKAERPEVAAIEEAGPARGSSAVAAAVAEEASSNSTNMPVPDSDEERPDRADADNSRRPIVKDTTRAQRNRPRSNAVKKKTKVAAPKASATGKTKKAQKMET